MAFAALSASNTLVSFKSVYKKILHIACTAGAQPWVAQYNLWLLIELMSEGVVFSFTAVQAGIPPLP